MKYRKAFSYWLTYTHNFVNPHRQALAQAFRKWKYLAPDFKEQLTHIKKDDLQYICVKNDDKISYISQSFDDCSDAIENLTDQRDILLKRYVGS